MVYAAVFGNTLNKPLLRKAGLLFLMNCRKFLSYILPHLYQVIDSWPLDGAIFHFTGLWFISNLKFIFLYEEFSPHTVLTLLKRLTASALGWHFMRMSLLWETFTFFPFMGHSWISKLYPFVYW